MSDDETHLDCLAVVHYIVGGMLVLFACFPLLHMMVGLSMVTGWEFGGFSNSPVGAPPPEIFGWMFFLMGLLFFLGGQAAAWTVIVSGRFLKRRKNRMFSFVVACVTCMFVPLGTILGVFTIIVLSRESVRRRYEAHAHIGNGSPRLRPRMF